MRCLAVLLFCLMPSLAWAKPSHYHATDTFSGDRWTMAWGGMAVDVIKAKRCAPPFGCKPAKGKAKKVDRHERAAKAHRPVAVIVPLPRVRPEMDEDQAAAYRAIAELLAGGKVYVRPAAQPVAPQSTRTTLVGGFAREIGRAFGTPRRFIRGRLVCAVNVNAALAERGIRGTRSALAKSFLRWGRPTRPVPGAVAVFNRGRSGKSGHVAIVHSVKPNGTVIYLNPSARRQAWVVGPYRRRPIAFRVAS